MRFEYADKEYRIYFQHGAKSTSCFIEECFETPKIQGSKFYCGGASFLAPGDRYCKETGRKVSLTHALEGQPKDFRQAAWEGYFSRKSQPWQQ